MYNVGNTLRAFALIQERCPEAQLTLTGDGQQRRELEDLAARLQLQMLILGRFLPIECRLCAGLRHLSQQFRHRNMPALDSGSVCRRHARDYDECRDIPNIVSDSRTAMVVNCNDAEAMAKWAVILAQNAEIVQNIIENARQECSKYQWETVKIEWLNLYRALYDRGVAGSP